MDIKKKGLNTNIFYTLLTVSILVVYAIVFRKFLLFLGRETISWILIIFTYIGFIKFVPDIDGKWSFWGIIRAIGTATLFIVIAALMIRYIRNSDCVFNILNRYCL